MSVSSTIPVAIAAADETKAKSITHQPTNRFSGLVNNKNRASKKIAAEKSAIGKWINNGCNSGNILIERRSPGNNPIGIDPTAPRPFCTHSEFV